MIFVIEYDKNPQLELRFSGYRRCVKIKNEDRKI
jgi:hypothetical protein